MDLKKNFAKKLKEIRERDGLTQTELANELGVSRGSISYYEKMERVPDIDFLEKVSEREHCTADYLLGLCTHKTHDEKISVEVQFQRLYKSIRVMPGYRSLVDTLIELVNNTNKLSTSILSGPLMLLLENINLLLDDAVKIKNSSLGVSAFSERDFPNLIIAFINDRELVYDRTKFLWTLALLSLRSELQGCNPNNEQDSLLDAALQSIDPKEMEFAELWVKQQNTAK